MKYVKNTRRTKPRLAVVVSKKITKSAPKRNRIRRRLYESVRRQWPDNISGYDMVVSVFDERVGTIASEELDRSVRELLQSSGLSR